MKTASYFTAFDNGKVRCDLCPHRCLLTDGKTGICLSRQNRGGALVSLNYCRPVSTAIDPIEKKPLFHFHPGARIYSTGPNGCTFKCDFCQNCEISQQVLPTREVPAAKLADAIIGSGTIGVAYTYAEPYIWFETIMEVGALVKKQGMVNVMVTNGYMEPAPLAELLTLVDAMNIDIKSMDPRFYKRLCKGDLAPVLRACEAVKKAGCHLEITNLLIPGENDSEKETRELAGYIASDLGHDTPLHISRYFPRHRLRRPSTPESALMRAWEIARERLDYVYVGNIACDKENTLCPSCGATLITRDGYRVRMRDKFEKAGKGLGKCKGCGKELPIVI
jgi:pyruvate formate lyase activating enzyme